MLKPGEILPYELSVIFGGCLMMMVLQVITGPILTWMMWAISFAIVTLCYVDYVIVGWNDLYPAGQFVRAFTNAAITLGAAALLYFSIVYLIPDVDPHNLASVLHAVQYSMRAYENWGPFIYFELYILFYMTTLSFFRLVINTALIFVAIFQNVEWNMTTTQALPVPARRSEHPQPQPQPAQE